MGNKNYGLYKRIMKRDPFAIDEIKTLEQAKEIIKMMTGNVYLGGKVYNDLFPKFEEKFVNNRCESADVDIDK